MDVEEAIRTRRTHKVYGSEPVDRALLTELLELGRWAPNHHLTNPWRFRVLGPEALERLKAAVGGDGAAKLDRAPTLVASPTSGPRTIRPSTRRTSWPPAAPPTPSCSAPTTAGWPPTGARPRSCASLPAARPSTSPTASTASASCTSAPPRQEQRVPERAPLDEVVTFLA